MTDSLAFLAQSRLFLWGVAAAVFALAAAAIFLRKRHAIPSSDQRQRIGWGKRLAFLTIAVLITALISGGLALLIRPDFTVPGSSQRQQSPIDAVYLLDVSVSMTSPYWWPALYPVSDCLDREGNVRVKSEENRADCAAITVLDRLLTLNPEANVAVVMFGGTTVVIGPTSDHGGLMRAVWLNWNLAQSQIFTGATDIRGALLKTWETLGRETDGHQRKIPIVVASDFGDYNEIVLIDVLSRLVGEGANIYAIAISAYDTVLSKVEAILGGPSVFVIEDADSIEALSLSFGTSPKPDRTYDGALTKEEPSFSRRVAIGVGMLAAALAVGALFIRVIRWPGGE